MLLMWLDEEAVAAGIAAELAANSTNATDLTVTTAAEVSGEYHRMAQSIMFLYDASTAQ